LAKQGFRLIFMNVHETVPCVAVVSRRVSTSRRIK
jgi:hypothetical protein